VTATPARPDHDLNYFRVSPEVLLPLGVEQLQDPALAILELLKNSWDADARIVSIRIGSRRADGNLVVRDNGHGMSSTEFVNRWLVIGASYKRTSETTEGGRPLIGEKGLGRLASFALGKSITISSARTAGRGFSAVVHWDDLSKVSSLDQYRIAIHPKKRGRGTRIQIGDLNRDWGQKETEFLTAHAEFLTAVPGEKFSVTITVDKKRYRLASPSVAMSRLSEAEIEVLVQPDGKPQIDRCTVDDRDRSKITFREMRKGDLDPTLSGARFVIQFFRRDQAVRRLKESLQTSFVAGLLDRYQGIRIYRDGINVPPYGLQGNDWAGLEKQRTQTGGPTMVPGNSQLSGELHISRKQHPQFVITAGRAGFSDQQAVSALARYVRWAVKELGTARRAAQRNISVGDVPSRVDDPTTTTKRTFKAQLRSTIGRVSQSRLARDEPDVRQLAELSEELLDAFGRSEETLRLYAQLASTGIAATSFVHELRTEFDVITDALDELSRDERKPDRELLDILNGAWTRIRAFVALFQVMPVKLRRRPKLMTPDDLRTSATTILRLAPSERIASEVVGDPPRIRMVPAELDSVLLNLISNAVKAIDASPNRESGRIRIAFSSSGDVLDVRVADNGCGVAPNVVDVMFEPLEGQFSEGTGMGLPIVQFIAERYGGHAELSSKAPPGYTTELRVVFNGVSRT
jgi:signal transduction histidine kinase